MKKIYFIQGNKSPNNDIYALQKNISIYTIYNFEYPTRSKHASNIADKI